jgi:hypothetical protein
MIEEIALGVAVVALTIAVTLALAVAIHTILQARK